MLYILTDSFHSKTLFQKNYNFHDIKLQTSGPPGLAATETMGQS